MTSERERAAALDIGYDPASARLSHDRGADAEPARARLLDAISGERQHWHRVEVDPRDIEAALSVPAPTLPALDGVNVAVLAEAMSRYRFKWLGWTDDGDRDDERRRDALTNAARDLAKLYAEALRDAV